MNFDEIVFVAKYINDCRWQPAKTGVPHEYTIREWRPDAEADFERFAVLIRQYGVKENFWKKVHIYLYFNDLKYWTMGWPIHETTVINRCPQGDFYGRQEREIS